MSAFPRKSPEQPFVSPDYAMIKARHEALARRERQDLSLKNLQDQVQEVISLLQKWAATNQLSVEPTSTITPRDHFDSVASVQLQVEGVFLATCTLYEQGGLYLRVFNEQSICISESHLDWKIHHDIAKIFKDEFIPLLNSLHPDKDH